MFRHDVCDGFSFEHFIFLSMSWEYLLNSILSFYRQANVLIRLIPFFHERQNGLHSIDWVIFVVQSTYRAARSRISTCFLDACGHLTVGPVELIHIRVSVVKHCSSLLEFVSSFRRLKNCFFTKNCEGVRTTPSGGPYCIERTHPITLSESSFISDHPLPGGGRNHKSKSDPYNSI